MTKFLLALTSVSLLTLTSCAHSQLKERESIEERIKLRKDDYRACYEKEINANPKLGAGKVNVAFIINEDGTTNQVAIADTTLNNPNVENCILNVIQTTHFEPHETPKIHIRYPFSFTPGEKPFSTIIFTRFSDQECQTVIKIGKSVVSTKTNIDEVVRSFLVGPGKVSNASALRAPDPKLKNLYLGHRLDETTLILRFKASAMELLNTTPCTQHVNIAPLEQMLLEVKGVKSIRFEIGGKLVEGWDA